MKTSLILTAALALGVVSIAEARSFGSRGGFRASRPAYRASTQAPVYHQPTSTNWLVPAAAGMAIGHSMGSRPVYAADCSHVTCTTPVSATTISK